MKLWKLWKFTYNRTEYPKYILEDIETVAAKVARYVKRFSIQVLSVYECRQQWHYRHAIMKWYSVARTKATAYI